MKDGYDRQITYARISVTDLCNMRCRYCMPDGVEKKAHKDILTIEELCLVSDALSELGVAKQRITGGEPLVRRGITSFFRHAGENGNIKDLAVTTNGQLLSEYVGELKSAGVNALNISIDTLDESKYKLITGGGELSGVLHGIETAIKAGFEKIKLNAVLLKGINDGEIKRIADFGKERNLPVRFIELMPFACQFNFANQYFIGANEVIKTLNLQFDVENDDRSKAEGYLFEDGTKVAFIRPVTNRFCADCNRIRITADGKLLNCLHECKEYDLRPYLQDKEGLKAYVEECVLKKPAHHNLELGQLQRRVMEDIGG